MAIARRGFTTLVDDRGVNTATLVRPSVVAGDMMYAFIGSIAFAPTTISAPSGWTKIGERNNPGTDNTTSWVYQKAATGSEPADYTWTIGNNGKTLGVLAAYSGVDTAATPVLVSDGWVDPAKTVIAPSITPVTGDWVITYQFGRQSPSTTAIKSWVNNSHPGDSELVDTYNQDNAARLGTHALWDSNGAVTGGAQARTITASVNIQQVTVHSLRIPASSASGGGAPTGGPNAWNGMG